jgi:cytochrome c-type biogenesis protein CcmH/NrfG
MARVKDGLRGNKNAQKWSFEVEMCLHHIMAPLRAKGLSDRKAAQEIARSQKLYSQLPESNGLHRTSDGREKRSARYLKRLQRLVPRLARAAMPYMSVADYERVGADMEAAKPSKDIPPAKP